MKYKIQTEDGITVRKIGTRPYVQALIYRYSHNNEVFSAEKMTINPKHSNGHIEKEYTSRLGNLIIAKWEKVIAKEL